MGGTRFMVQWEEHPSHLATRLGQLLEHQTLVDVTLMCNTHTLRVHRAVLAACSPYFETILQRQLGMHPLIVLKDMQFSVLKSLIEFMYCGETSVTEDNLGALLQAAKFFQVKGLSAMTKEALGLVPNPKAAVNGDAARKAFVGRPKRVGLQPTFVTTSSVKPVSTSVAAATGSSTEPPKPTFQTVPKPVPATTTPQQAESAQLLLSLAGGSEFPGKTAAVSAGTTTVTPQASFHTVSKNVRFHHSLEGKKEPTTTEPRKRGRPVKRQTNVVFQEKVMTDADMALHKEAEASRKALEMLRQEMRTEPEPVAVPVTKQLPLMAGSSKLHATTVLNTVTTTATSVAKKPGTNIVYKTAGNIVVEQAPKTHSMLQGITAKKKVVEAPVVTEPVVVAPPEEEPPASEPKPEPEEPQEQQVYQLSPEEAAATTTEVVYQPAGSSVMSQYMEVLKEAGLPTDVPILLDSGDGSYVTVNEEVLMNIVNGGVLQCHVTEGSLVTGEGIEFVVQEVQGVEEAEKAEAGDKKEVLEEEVAAFYAPEVEETMEEESVNTLEGEESMDVVAEEEEASRQVGGEVITGDRYGESAMEGFPVMHREDMEVVEEEAKQPEEMVFAEAKPPVEGMVYEETKPAEEGMVFEEAKQSEEGLVFEEAKQTEEELVFEEAKQTEEGLVYEEAKQPEDSLVFEEAKQSEEGLVFEEAKHAEEGIVFEEAKQAEEGIVFEEAKQSDEGLVYEEAKPAEEGVVYEEAKQPDEGLVYEEAKPAEEGMVYEEAKQPDEGLVYEEAKQPDEGLVYEEAKQADEGLVYEEAKQPDEGLVYEEAKQAEEAIVFEEAKQLEEGMVFDEQRQTEDSVGFVEQEQTEDSVSGVSIDEQAQMEGSVSLDEANQPEEGVVCDEDQAKQQDQSIELNEAAKQQDESMGFEVTEQMDDSARQPEDSMGLDEAKQVDSGTGFNGTTQLEDEAGQTDQDTASVGTKLSEESMGFEEAKQSEDNVGLIETNQTNDGDSCDAKEPDVPSQQEDDTKQTEDGIVVDENDPESHLKSMQVKESMDIDETPQQDTVDADETKQPEDALDFDGKEAASLVFQEGDKEGPAKMSVEEALQEMMGDSSDTEGKAGDDEISQTTEQRSPEQQAEELRLVLSPEEEREPPSLKIVSPKDTSFESAVGEESFETAVGEESTMEDRTGEQTTVEEPQKRPEEVDVVGTKSSSVEGSDKGEMQAMVVGEGDLAADEEEGSEAGAVASPNKDIPFAVGLLPLKTALEKLQAMPEYHPRKTRSSSTSSLSPAARVKRKASSVDGPDKKQKTEPEDEEMDTSSEECQKTEPEDESEEQERPAPAPAPAPVHSMPEILADTTEG